MSFEEITDPEVILEQLEELDDVHQMVAATTRAIRLADFANDDEIGMRARLVLLYVAPRTRYADEMITAFTWCHGKLEAEPERFVEWEEDVVEQFDTVINTLVDYPQVSLEQLHEGIEQMEQCYQRLELPMRRVAEQRFTTALRTGNVADAERLLVPWKSTGEPDCVETRAWERISEFELLVMNQQYEQGLEMLSRNLKNRNGLSEDVFLWSVSHALRPLTLLGRTDEARRYQKTAEPLLKNEPTDALGAGSQIAFLTHIHELSRALSLFQEYLQPGMEAPDPDAHFRIAAASAGLMRALSKENETCLVTLPNSHPLHQKEGEYNCQTLADWFETFAKSVGQKFDERNGNDYFNGRLYFYFNY